MRRSTNARYEHTDCTGCHYLGTFGSAGKTRDYYFCDEGGGGRRGTVISRYGSEPYEYESADVRVAEALEGKTPIREVVIALQLARKKRYVPVLEHKRGRWRESMVRWSPAEGSPLRGKVRRRKNHHLKVGDTFRVKGTNKVGRVVDTHPPDWYLTTLGPGWRDGKTLEKVTARKNPLTRGYSARSVSANVAREVRAGRPQKQAVAIALSTARKAYRKKHPRGALPAALRRPNGKAPSKKLVALMSAVHALEVCPNDSAREQKVVAKALGRRDVSAYWEAQYGSFDIQDMITDLGIAREYAAWAWRV